MVRVCVYVYVQVGRWVPFCMKTRSSSTTVNMLMLLLLLTMILMTMLLLAICYHVC